MRGVEIKGYWCSLVLGGYLGLMLLCILGVGYSNFQVACPRLLEMGGVI